MLCPVCHGSGEIEYYYNEYDIHSEKCWECDGWGHVEDHDYENN